MIFCLTDFGLWLTEDNGYTFRPLRTGTIFNQMSSWSGDISGNTIVASLGSWTRKGIAISHDLGTTWNHLSDSPERYPFVAFHPKQPNIVYASSFRSTNKAYDWERMSVSVKAFYPGNGDIIYGVTSAGRHECHITKSTNQGRSWETPYPPCKVQASSVRQIIVSPNDPDRVYLATPIGVWIFDGKIWILRNEGHGLTKDNFGLCFISSVAVDPNNPNIVYATRDAPGRGHSNGIFLSTDRGLTWSNITGTLVQNLSIFAVRISPFDSLVYIGTAFGTFRSRPPSG